MYPGDVVVQAAHVGETVVTSKKKNGVVKMSTKKWGQGKRIAVLFPRKHWATVPWSLLSGLHTSISGWGRSATIPHIVHPPPLSTLPTARARCVLSFLSDADRLLCAPPFQTPPSPLYTPPGRVHDGACVGGERVPHHVYRIRPHAKPGRVRSRPCQVRGQRKDSG